MSHDPLPRGPSVPAVDQPATASAAEAPPVTIITDDHCLAYHHAGHPEHPARVRRTAERLREQRLLSVSWVEPLPVSHEQLLRAHSPALLERLLLPRDFDADTPAHPGIRTHAERSAGGALRAFQAALAGETALSLLRPPGHHATRDHAMGFCYLNSIAIAALEALALNVGRVAVFDFDTHHGNGTEEILLDRQGCAFFSVHQFPSYPETGDSSQGNARNYPVRPHASRGEYRDSLAAGLDGLRRFRPGIVGVSAGFDAFCGDPVGQGKLEVEDYRWLGASFRGLGVPVFSILEGGYSRELPELVLAYLHGLTGR